MQARSCCTQWQLWLSNITLSVSKISLTSSSSSRQTTTSYLFKALLSHILQKKALGSGQTDLMFVSPVCFDSITLTRHFLVCPFDWPLICTIFLFLYTRPVASRGQEGAQLYFLPHQLKFYVPYWKICKNNKNIGQWYNYNVHFLCTSIPLY